MEEDRRSREHSGIVVKNRSSSGCLIVKKKGDEAARAASSSGTRKVFDSKKEKKRSRLVLSESGSSDELLVPARSRVGPDTIRVCNGLAGYDNDVVEESEIGRKRNRLDRTRHNEDFVLGRNGDDPSDGKRNKLDVFEFNEYDGMDGDTMMRKHFDDGGADVSGRRLLGSMTVGRSGIEREYEVASSRGVVIEKRKNSYFDRKGSLKRRDRSYKNRFEMSTDESRLPISLLRDKYMVDSDEPIRLQGKNGVLKVMVNKKKKASGSLRNFDLMEAQETHSGLKIQDSVRNAPLSSSIYSENEDLDQSAPFVGTRKNEINSQKSPSTKNGDDQDSEASDTSLKPEQKNVETLKSKKAASSKGNKTQAEHHSPAKIKEGKVRRGSGTEKQRLRERIRGMLLEAGWTIDYRPRRNRDYLDAVYINPVGTAYWSIIKAYDALLKQLNHEEDEAKPSRDGASFTPIADEVLSQLTRKTRKKIEEEMQRKQRDGSDSEIEKETGARKSSSTRHEDASMDSVSDEEKLSSFKKQGGKSLKSKMNENGTVSVNLRSQSFERLSSASNSHKLHGRKSKKLGRCTLLVRSSKEGQNSETDGFVPYSGKRTLLSWLIDSGTVQSSERLRYMNRRQTKTLQKGWITREGIHCGCCSKILTVSKFEIHAGSKLRQPFQNIYLESGISLLQCQIDAWNRQEGSEHFGFHSVDIDGDDPNDDTCGICGDGGDLICCDGCPSTFHQSCLDIQILPQGDWHCPNCTCKFCGIAHGDATEPADDITVYELFTCRMCDKKCHRSCIPEMDSLPADSIPSFCGQKCRGLFEHLQKYLGIKHELEAGFSWSLIHRVDTDPELSSRSLPQRVENNSKLAVALTIMDECFLPIVDRRSGINLIHNVLYNCGSNFNRLNYSGFYTAILEKEDEIISAASIRFHGTKLAEMPYIGTRHIYRRQGMCRRLFGAIESALCTLKVENLVIPAIAEFMHAWTEVFGFTPLEDSLKKEMRSMNMLVFPGIDMLQKQLLNQENAKGDSAADTGARQKVLKLEHSITPEVETKPYVDCSAKQEHHEQDDSNPSNKKKVNVALVSDSQTPHVSLDDVSAESSLIASQELQIPALAEGITCVDSLSINKTEESADLRFPFVSNTSDDTMKMEKKPRVGSPVKDNTWSHKEGDRDDTHQMDANVVACREVKTPVSIEETINSDSPSLDELAVSPSGSKCFVSHSSSQATLEAETKQVYGSHVDNNSHSFKKASMGVEVAGDASDKKCLLLSDRSRNLDNPLSVSPVVGKSQCRNGCCIHDPLAAGVDVAASHKTQVLTGADASANSEAGVKLQRSSSGSLYHLGSDTSCVALEGESKAVLPSPVEDNLEMSRKDHTEDGHVPDASLVTSSQIKLVAPVKVTVGADPLLGKKLAESASARTYEGDVESCNEDDINNNTEPVTFPMEIFTEKIGDKINGIPGFSCSNPNAADVSSSLQINSNSQIKLEEESKSDMAN